VRNTASFTVTNTLQFKQQMLGWANRFNICCFLDSHDYHDIYQSYNCLVGVGAATIFNPQDDFLKRLKAFTQQHDDWLFGHISYEANSTLASQNSFADHLQFPEIFLFQPQIVVELISNTATIHTLAESAENVFAAIKNFSHRAAVSATEIHIQHRVSKEDYLETVEELRQQILRGNCYEINFCQEFFAENVALDPLYVYQQLLQFSPTPFAAFYKIYDKYVCCASPERYLKKTGSTIISQPIKGTIKRDHKNGVNDEALKQQLQHSKKDQSENVMVVDLVRNDLSKICVEGSVHVKELFGVYTFPTVHQMISTIAGELKANVDVAEVLNATFPMGSMTGAPKKKVMELIHKFEVSKRGIYSGSIGYITPQKNFDFNVVIRSIMYNETNKYLSYQVGSGITFNSIAEQEYEECLLKAEAIKKALR